MNNPLISIIVPIYNYETFLNQCIQSIQSQSLSEIEIILVNDGSTDGSGRICDEYSKKDSRIRVIHKKNGGLSDARNKGIAEATARYLYFIDSDDWIEPNALEFAYNTLKTENVDIVLGCAILNYKDKSRENVKNKTKRRLKKEEALELLLLNKIITSYVWGNLYKRELFNDISFPLNRNYEDYSTMHKIFANANFIMQTNIALYHYRQHENSIIHTPDPQNRYHMFLGEKDRYEFILENKNLFLNLDALLVKNIENSAIFLNLILVLTEKGEMQNELSEIKDFIKKFPKRIKKKLSLSRRLKIRIATQHENTCRKILKKLSSSEDIHKCSI